nr:hypothetical protein [uncultured organism]
MNATATSNYIGEAMKAANALAPPSLADNPALLAWNLFVMTAAFCLGLMMVGKQVRRIWAARSIDHPTDPVSLYRFLVLLAGGAVASRGFAEALSLWSWSSGDPRTIEHVAEFKRWLDPISVFCGFTWMALHILAEPMLEFQLRKAPLPVDMWSRWPQLRRPVLILIVSLLMAAAAVGLR